MNPDEYAVMARVEASHWWYRALRDILARTLSDAGLPQNPAVLDAGCGTGESIRFLADRLAPSYLGGFDHSAEAVEIARAKNPGADIYQSDLCDPEIRVESLDLAISLDVICIPGVARARPGLLRIAERLRRGGLLVINLPAFTWLRSEHDVAVHTTERYTPAELRQLVNSLGLEMELLTCRLGLLFPAVIATRLGSIVGDEKKREEAHSDLHEDSPGWLDASLFTAMRAENWLIAHGLRMPIGSSVYAVARKP